MMIGTLEILQRWMPGRLARLEDLVVDAAAACAGLAIAAALDSAVQRMQRTGVAPEKKSRLAQS